MELQENHQTAYRLPPKEIIDLVDRPAFPGVSMGPGGKFLVLLERPSLPPIEDLARPELRLAGIRIDPKTSGPSRSNYIYSIKVRKGNSSPEIKGIPKGGRISNLSWSADGNKLALVLTQKESLELWIADLPSMKAHKVDCPPLNGALGGLPYRWLSDSKRLICRVIPDKIGNLPSSEFLGIEPIIKENLDKSTPGRTYQDLLRNPTDEAIFTHFAQTQLVIAELGKKAKKLGDKAMIRIASPSPDGNYFLVFILEKPFSYVVPYSRFPFRVEVWNVDGKLIRKLAKIPLSDDIPIGFEAVRKGMRTFYWRADLPASLYWVEALDEGDPKQEVSHRDQIFRLDAPFKSKPKKSIKTGLRFSNLTWGNGNLAVCDEWRWTDRKLVTSIFNPDDPETGKTVLFDRSWEDSYNDPGNFETTTNEFGRQVLLRSSDEKSLFLIGSGDSPEGKMPFIDQFNLSEKQSTRLWRSEPGHFEMPVEIMDPVSMKILTKRESKEEPPNYFIRNLKKGSLKALTNFPHPYQVLRNVDRMILQYKRKDGVDLQGKLYLPPGYSQEKDGPLPLLMWAYPKEYKSNDAAGQLTDSPYQFLQLSPHSPLPFLTQGYAVLNGFSMPVVGEGSAEPNENFVDQIIWNAKAAIDKVVEMGIADRNRIAIGGHSYGAFMAANLVAHSDLFAAAIARSGAYNRTLTPFGFQSEERTFWEAKQTYIDMSPFSYAHQIKTPILLIHGEADNNSGTFPMQSERFYNALKGHGAISRLVILPHESHGYQARESILHMFWEMLEWLNRYLGE